MYQETERKAVLFVNNGQCIIDAFVVLLRALYRVSASSHSSSSFTRLNTYRHSARFFCHRYKMCGLFWERFTWRLFVMYIIFFSSFLRLTCFHSKVITSTFQRQADVTPANIKIAFYRRYNTTTIITKYVITKNVIMILLHRWKQYQEKPIQNLIRYKDTTHEYPTFCRFWNLTHQKRRQHLRLPPIGPYPMRFALYAGQSSRRHEPEVTPRSGKYRILIYNIM